MALNKRPTFVNVPSLAAINIENADGTNPVDVLTAGDFGNKIVSLFASGEATAPREITLKIFRDPDTIILWTVNVPIDAGRDPAIPPVDLFTTEVRAMLPIDGDEQPYFFLAPGDVLRAVSNGAVTAADKLGIICVHGDFDDTE